MQWMIAFIKSTMTKFKPQYLLTFLMLCIIEVGFSQNVRFQKDLTKKDNLWYSGEELYIGEVITLSQDQIETRYSVEKGVPSGMFTKYFLNNTFKKSNYQDTAEIRRLNQEIVIENNKLNSLIKDSLLAYNKLISYINDEIGGDKKLQKLLEKALANKLKEKQKVLVQAYVAQKTSSKNSAQNVLLSQQKIKLTNTKLKEEEAKPVVTPKIAEQYEQINSIKNGSYKSYFNDGKLKSEGTFLNGLYNGAWIYYYSNGNVQAKGSFVSGDGTDVSEISGLPRNGRDGFWIFKHDNGKISQESNYLKGKLNGGFKDYNNVGVLTEESFYKNGVLDGKLVKYNNQAIKISEANFINGIAEGEEKIYYDSGKLKIQRSYKQGKLDGVAKAFYENGNLEELSSYVKGIEDGVSKDYYENGNIKLEGATKNGKAHGTFKSYFENGKTQYSGTIDTNSLTEGHFVGELFAYNEDGSLKSKIMAYKDGRLEDITPKPESKLSKTEISKPYKCKCCKSTINGILDGVDKEGNIANIGLLEIFHETYSSPEWLKLLNIGIAFSGEAPYKTAYDVYRRDQYKFCSMKCSRTCYE